MASCLLPVWGGPAWQRACHSCYGLCRMPGAMAPFCCRSGAGRVTAGLPFFLRSMPNARGNGFVLLPVWAGHATAGLPFFLRSMPNARGNGFVLLPVWGGPA